MAASSKWQGLTRSLVFAGVMSLFPIGLLYSSPSEEGADEFSRAYSTKTGKKIIIKQTHPAGRSLATIEVRTEGFEHNFREVFEDRNPISEVLAADLDDNGFDEIYIATTAAGSGGYGTILGFASNRDKSLSMVHFPERQEGEAHFAGYMGHDSFTIEDRKLVRMFPIYNKGDTNEKPTGGWRKLTYVLVKGEAMWQLRVEQAEKLCKP